MTFLENSEGHTRFPGGDCLSAELITDSDLLLDRNLHGLVGDPLRVKGLAAMVVLDDVVRAGLRDGDIDGDRLPIATGRLAIRGLHPTASEQTGG